MKQPPPTEKIALWILAALRAEYEREPSLLNCRLFSEVIGPTMQEHQLESADIDRGLRFLLEKRCLSATNSPRGRAILPTTVGLEYLSAHNTAEKNKTAWTMDRRLVLYTIIVAILGVMAAIVAYYWPR
jgi:hypothetical protein